MCREWCRPARSPPLRWQSICRLLRVSLICFFVVPRAFAGFWTPLQLHDGCSLVPPRIHYRAEGRHRCCPPTVSVWLGLPSTHIDLDQLLTSRLIGIGDFGSV